MAKSKTQDPTHTTLDGEAELDKYVREHSDKEPEYLYRLYRDTNVRLLQLKMLVEMAKPRNVLEVGTFSGYSALCLAEGLSEDAHLYTFEINDEQEDFTRKWIEGSPLSDRISFIIGNAIEEVPRIASEKGIAFDMAFIDGDKRTYVETYEMVLPLMSKGGWILADNTLWDGHVIDPEYAKDNQTKGIRAFNDVVANDDRVEKVMIPLRDGLTLIRKK